MAAIPIPKTQRITRSVLDVLLWASTFSCSSRLSNIDNLLGVMFLLIRRLRGRFMSPNRGGWPPGYDTSRFDYMPEPGEMTGVSSACFQRLAKDRKLLYG